jgi:hypothetical protein
MSTLTITIGIVAPVITFLIGLFFRSEKIKKIKKSVTFWHEYADALELSNRRLNESNQLLTTQNAALVAQISELATVQIVANKDKHPAANDNYLYIEGDINENREAGLFTLNDWNKAKERLLKNLEDKPL